MSVRSFSKKYIAEITVFGVLLTLICLVFIFWKPNLGSIVTSIKDIPDLAIRIVVILLFISAIYIIIKIRKLLNPKILDLPDDLKNHKAGSAKFAEEIRGKISEVRTIANSVYNRFEKYEKLDRDEEVRFVLELVGNSEEEKMDYEDIKRHYFSKFPDKKPIDFNSLWKNYLLRKEFLEQDRGSSGYGDTDYYFITSM